MKCTGLAKMEVDCSLLNCYGDDQLLSLRNSPTTPTSFDRRVSKQIVDQYLDESNFEQAKPSSTKIVTKQESKNSNLGTGRSTKVAM